MSSRLKALSFAAVLCLVCSILLTAASTGLQSYQQKNIALDKQKNILQSVGLADSEKSYDPGTIEKLYYENIKPFWVDSAGRIVPQGEHSDTDLPLYLYLVDNVISAYIMPINTRGLWGKIHGYLAVEADGETISGFTVYKHSETPGLGGEIERRWFQKNFKGKKIVNRAGGFVAVGVAKGFVQDEIPSEEQINYVDGISGATFTGKYLASGLHDILLNYEPISIKFRKNQMKGVGY
ncbi:FMN-binding protein [Thermodesulfobacteriota bacterium]